MAEISDDVIEIRVPCKPEYVRTVRRTIAEFATFIDMPRSAIEEVEIAASEAVANKHPMPGAAGACQVLSQRWLADRGDHRQGKGVCRAATRGRSRDRHKPRRGHGYRADEAAHGPRQLCLASQRRHAHPHDQVSPPVCSQCNPDEDRAAEERADGLATPFKRPAGAHSRRTTIPPQAPRAAASRS